MGPLIQETHFQIFGEALETTTGNRLFDRDNPTGSPLKNALKHIEMDDGVLAAARKAALEGNRPLQQIPFGTRRIIAPKPDARTN